MFRLIDNVSTPAVDQKGAGRRLSSRSRSCSNNGDMVILRAYWTQILTRRQSSNMTS